MTYNLLNTLADGALTPFDFFFNDDDYSTSSTMKTDIRETEKEYFLDVELPGFDKKNLELSYNDGYLTVTAKIHNDEKENHHKFLRRERYMGTYERSYYVGEVEKDAIKANYKDGILEISIPKEDKKLIESKHSIQID